MHKGYLNLYRQIMTERVFEFQAIDILGYLDRITDWSAANRFMKWSSAWDGFKLHPVLGYGTGVTHVMDGNYIKLLGETGFLGTGLWMFIYGYFMRAVYKARRVSKIAVPVLLIMVSILLNSLLVDMFEASKPMEMMWLLVGAVIGTGALAKEKRNFS